MTGSLDPAALVEKILAGEPGAEDQLVARYNRGVMVVIRQSVSDSSQAQDIYQETFQLLLQKIRAGEVREPERLSGYVVSVARNVTIEHFRKTARRAPAESLDAEWPSPAPSQLDGLLKQEKAALARQVLAELPSDRDRKVLYRFYIAEDEKDEICRDLGLSSLLFNQVLFRARERFRKLFEDRRHAVE